MVSLMDNKKIAMSSLIPGNILFCGDTHGRLKHIQKVIDKNKPEAVILLGDIQAEEPLHELLQGTNVYFIPGNHDVDTPKYSSNLFDSDYKDNNLHNRVVEIEGVKIAGLGGVFNSDIWMPPSEPLYENLEQWCDANRWTNPNFEMKRDMHANGTIFYDDYINLMMQQADILVIHDAPSCHPYGFEALDELARAMGVKTVFHGDHHDSLDYSEDEAHMGFRTYGVGLRGITDLSGRHVVEGELDRDRFEQRMAKKQANDSMFKKQFSMAPGPRM